jgi:hypothetical protein
VSGTRGLGAELVDMARRLNIPVSSVVRMLLSDGLARFDRRYEAFIERLERVAELGEKTHAMAAAAVAAILLPEGAGHRLSSTVAEQFRTQVHCAVYWGSGIKAGHDSGAFSGDEDADMPDH